MCTVQVTTHSDLKCICLCLHILDKKFGVKARLNGMLPITLGLLKNCQSNHHQLVTVLSALKLLAANRKFTIIAC